MSKPINLTRPDIALICRDLGIGGVERIWINLANGFAQRGLRVDLILLDIRASHLSSTLEPNVNIVNLATQSSSFQKMFTMSFQSSGSIFKLAHYLRQERPRVLLAAAHYINELAILAKLIARVNTRVIVSEHVNITQELSQGVRPSNRFIPMTIRLLHRFADDIVAVSQGVAEDLRQYGLRNRSIKVIYNPIISDSFYRQAEEMIEFPWEQDASCPVIFSCARFVPHKHFEHIVHAFNRVLSQRPARLVLIGDGPEHHRVRHLVKELGLESV